MEVSPNGTYVIINYGKRIVIIRITPHKELVELVNPIFMIKSIAQYNIEQAPVKVELNVLREKVRKQILKNPLKLAKRIKELYEALIKDDCKTEN